LTTRAIFNRQYTEYTPGGQQVWLVNGAGVTTTPSSTRSFTAGATLIQGDVVFVSGTYVLLANAASGVASEQYGVIGVTAAAAALSDSVPVVLDDVAIISASNIYGGDTQLLPGSYYYLAKYDGKLTRYSTASGLVSASGGYAALVGVGQALSPSELQVEIESPIVLFD
jgi:hypothetical protein